MRRTDTDVHEHGQLPAAEPWPAGWHPEEVIRVLEPLVLDARRERIGEVLDQRLGSVTVVLDAPHDPHNGAAVLRSCDAFGVQRVHVVTREEPFAVSGRVSSGAARWVDSIVHPDATSLVRVLRDESFELVATHPEGELVPEDLADIPRVALMLGNERDGLRDQLAREADRSVRIPMRGFVESLNVSVSAAVLLAAATRHRPGDLSPSERTFLYARGLFRTVPRASEVLAASRRS